MKRLFQFLEEVISSEEMISVYIEKSEETSNTEKAINAKKPIKSKPKMRCMYCDENHKSHSCTRYKTPQERSRYLRENKLCLLCASAQHATKDCKMRPCFNCQGAHHTSCCYSALKTSGSRRESEPTTPTLQKGTRKERREEKQTTRTQLYYRGGANGKVVLATKEKRDTSTTFLPTGEVTVVDPNSSSLKKVHALLDTGAELSFIDSQLADELRLATVGERTLRLATFGSKEVRKAKCRKVQLPIWDAHGNPHLLQLMTHENLPKLCTTPPLSDEDLSFIKSSNIAIEIPKGKSNTVKPRLLIGCDQLWPLVRNDVPQIRLPSGLHILPTRLGSLLTGTLSSFSNMLHVGSSAYDEEELAWDQHWSLDSPMELNACTLAMRNSVFHELREQVTIRKVYVLSDSEIVLKWLKSKPNREVGQLVLNRLHEIGNIVTSLQQQNVSVFFGYIPSQHNPADCATRGLTKNTPKDHLWWKGPSFLVTSAENWPQSGTLFNLAQDQEEVKTDQCAPVSIAVAVDKPVSELIRAEQAFTFTQAKRILAWVIRFLLVLRHRIRRGNARFWPSESYVDPHNLVNKELSGAELKSARVALIRHHQTSRITSAVLSKLQHLDVKADQDGILRCYGGLGKASIAESAKYPVLIMQKTLIAKLIIRDCHAKGHPGVNHTMALVRQHY
ncbi:unnamed protein product [Nippostrongylus brasiliensis]|uniref:DUF1758 domain-containing protein n=1 Tax=Nippostrongylus brasiliensis TaxID=27835 RepID=A0A0N4Y2T7_NIPBR|nr:unnamed protein product [Nippostrongylus brasiliensis]